MVLGRGVGWRRRRHGTTGQTAPQQNCSEALEARVLMKRASTTRNMISASLQVYSMARIRICRGEGEGLMGASEREKATP